MPSAPRDTASAHYSARRRLTAIIAAVAVLGTSAVVAVTVGAPRHPGDKDAMSVLDCPRGTTSLVGLDPSGPISCVHADQPPAGVDVAKPVSTAELLTRDGAAQEAIAAAENAGVPTPASASAQDPRAVSCDGDGTSGYRVQAVYAYDPAKAVGSVGGDRFSSLEPKIQQWAAGVDTVFNRSAAMTGGYRSVRWVTKSDSSAGCLPAVIKVPMSSSTLNAWGLSAMMSDMQAAGHSLPNRKYLIWAEANQLCGIANVYSSGSSGGRYATAAQDNYNNGYAPMYTRVDTSCWGNSVHSTEAHELTHNLGGVLNNSPNHSAQSHCTDESDIMCYSDGAGIVMRTVCPPDNEILLDCNGDDYFSTRPAPGSWLATNWNTANSRFLIGGGDGTNGGAVGTNRSDVSANAGVAGLPTQASTSLTAPPGRTHATSWTTQTPRCAVTAAGDQATLRCAPGVVAGSFTATTTDSTGVSTQSTAEVPFDQTLRAATVTISGSADSCAAAPVSVTAKVADSASGLGVYGATVQFIQSGTVVGSAVTDTTGTAAGVANMTGAGTITARVADATYSGATPVGAVAVTQTCSVTSLTGYLADSNVPAGDPVIVRGTAADARGAAAGAVVTVKMGTQSINAVVNEYGYWNATFPTITATASVTASAGSVQNRSLGTVTMVPWNTSVTLSSPGASAGATAALTGQVLRDHPVTWDRSAVAGTVVTLRAGTWSTTATTDSLGRYTATTPALTVATPVTASVAATPSMTAASTTTTVSVSASYASALTLTAPASSWAGSTVTMSGTLVLTSQLGTAASVSGRTVTVKVVSAGVTRTFTAVTTSTGGYSVAVPGLAANATATASFAGTGGHPAATSAPTTVTVNPLTYATTLTITSIPTSVATGTAAVVTGQLMTKASSGATTPAAGAVVRVVATAEGSAPATYNATASTTGTWTVTLPARPARTSLTAYFDGTSAWPAVNSGAPRVIDVYAPTYTSAVSLTSAPTSAGYGQTSTVAGTLKFTSSAGPVPSMTGHRVRVVFTPSGASPATVYATASSTGAWTAKSPALTRATTVSVFFDKVGTIPQAPAVPARTIAVGNFATLPVVSSSTTKLTGAGTATVTGTVYKVYGTTKLTRPTARVTVKVYDAAGAYRNATTVTTDSYGRFTAKVAVSYTGTLRTSVAAATGTGAGTAPNRGISVAFKSSMTLSTRTAKYNAYLTASTQLSPARGSRPMYLQRYANRKWSTVVVPKTDKYGRAKASVKQTVRGTVYYRWYTPGDRYNLSAYSPQLSVSVK